LNAAAAQTVRVLAIDDCGNPLSKSYGDAIEIIFDNQDQPLDLHDTGKGIWEAAWVPQNTAKAATLQAVAFEKRAPAAATPARIKTLVQSMILADVPPVISGVVNAAESAQAIPQLVATGSYVAVYGTDLTSGRSESAAAVPLPTSLADAQLFIGDKPMPLVYAGPGQINALIPQGLNPNVKYQVSVVKGETRSVPVSVLLAAFQPGIFTQDSSGSGQGVAQIAGTALLAAPPSNISRPIQHGTEYLVIYCTGLGEVLGAHGETPPADGAAAPEGMLYQTTAATTATIGGLDAPVRFSGLTPTLVGLYQVNVQVPAAVPSGAAVPLVVTVTDPHSGVAIRSNAVAIAVE
jgi:uncharacterized protein (TIGR03437 family)